MNDSDNNANVYDWAENETQWLSAKGKSHLYRLSERLGEGASSIVWLAEELDPQDQSVIREKVVLKVLRPDASPDFREAFFQEILTFTALHDLVKGDLRAIPELYDHSSQSADVPYLAMEYVAYPTAENLAAPPNEALRFVEGAGPNAQRLRDELEAVFLILKQTVPDNSELLSNAETARDLAAEIVGPVDDLLAVIRDPVEKETVLKEHDVAIIGAQMCEVMQALHESGRYYKQDPQRKNLHYDLETRQIKVIDWNAISDDKGKYASDAPEWKDAIQSDVRRLAGLLYWMQTRIELRPDEWTPQQLERKGGTAWQETSLALRIAIERAFATQESQGYDVLFKDNDAKGLYAPRSFGAVLFQAASWLAPDATYQQLIRMAERFELDGKPHEAAALVELCRRRLRLDTSYTDRIARDAELQQLMTQIGSLDSRPAIEKGRRLLDAADFLRARDHFERIIAEAVEPDIQLHRWLSLTQALAAVADYSEQKELWDSGLLQEGVALLELGRWAEARIVFESVVGKWPDVDLKYLLQDARLGHAVDQIENEWPDVKNLQSTFPDEYVERRIQDLDDRLKEIEQLQATYTDHPYLILLTKDWPDISYLRDRLHEQVKLLADPLIDWPEGDQAWLNRLFTELSVRPGNAMLMQEALRKTEANLLAGYPERAGSVSSIALAYAGRSPLVSQIQEYQRFAVAWQRLRGAIAATSWQAAQTSADELRRAGSNSQNLTDVVKLDIENQREESEDATTIWNLARLESTLKEDPQLEQNLPAMKAEAEKSRQQELARVKQQIGVWRAEDSDESIERALQMATILSAAYIKGSEEQTQYETIAKELSVQLADQSIRNQGELEELNGDLLMPSLQREELAQARQHYEQAKMSFAKMQRNSDMYEKRMLRKMKHIDDVIERSSELIKLDNRVSERIADFEQLFKDFQRLQMPVPQGQEWPSLRLMSKDLVRIKRIHPESSRYEVLMAEALDLASVVGWGPDEFWNEFSPIVDWAEDFLTHAPPERLNESDWNQLSLALHESQGYPLPNNEIAQQWLKKTRDTLSADGDEWLLLKDKFLLGAQANSLVEHFNTYKQLERKLRNVTIKESFGEEKNE